MSRSLWELFIHWDTDEGTERYFVCSHCKSKHSKHNGKENWHYCPICGYEMEYPNESKN